MGELKVVDIECKDCRMSLEGKLGWLCDAKISDKKIEEVRKNPEKIKEYHNVIPNQVINFTVENSLGYSFQETTIKNILEKILLNLQFKGRLIEITDGKRRTTLQETYSAMISARIRGDKKDNKTNADNFNQDIILIKKFPANTQYGKVIDSDLPRQILNEISLCDDWHIITHLVDEEATYLCVSRDLAEELKNRFNEEEYITLPQVDLSDYVNELEDILKHQIFSKICDGSKIIEIMEGLNEFRENNYNTIAKQYEVIEHILRKITSNLGIPTSSMGKALDLLAGNDQNRRLFDETRCLIKAMGRNIQAHGKLDRPEDKKYLAILNIKSIRDIFYDWCFFEALFKCLDKLSQETGESIEDLWKRYLTDVKRREKEKVEYSREQYENIRFKIRYDAKRFIFNAPPIGEAKLIEIKGAAS